MIVDPRRSRCPPLLPVIIAQQPLQHRGALPKTRFWAQAYYVREPARWQALVELGRPNALATYPCDLSADQTPKDCCVRTPEPPAARRRRPAGRPRHGLIGPGAHGRAAVASVIRRNGRGDTPGSR